MFVTNLLSGTPFSTFDSKWTFPFLFEFCPLSSSMSHFLLDFFPNWLSTWLGLVVLIPDYSGLHYLFFCSPICFSNHLIVRKFFLWRFFVHTPPSQKILPPDPIFVSKFSFLFFHFAFSSSSSWNFHCRSFKFHLCLRLCLLASSLLVVGSSCLCRRYLCTKTPTKSLVWLSLNFFFLLKQEITSHWYYDNKKCSGMHNSQREWKRKKKYRKK